MRARGLCAVLFTLLWVSVVNRPVRSQVEPETVWLLKAPIELNAKTHNSHSFWFYDLPSPLSSVELRVRPGWVTEANEVIIWDVELLRYNPRTGNPGGNLLAEKAHGLQPFTITPDDVEGKGIYPPRRVIRHHGFHCVITVLGGETGVSQVRRNLKVLESLRLEIELGVDRQKASRSPKQKGSRTPKSQ